MLGHQAPIRTYNINKLTGEGEFRLNLNLSTLTADKLNITDALSDAIVKISADKINFLGVPTPDTVTDYDPIQILDGGTGAQLQIIGDGSFSEHVYKDYYDPIRADVYFDDQYNRYYTNGTVSGKIELAQTDSVNDSLKFTGVITDWDEEQIDRGNLLRDLNMFKTDEERFFRFRTADDEYLAPKTSDDAVTPHFGVTASGVLNIVGVSETLADGTVKRSTIDMNRGHGFDVTNPGTILNLSDVQFKNGRYFVVNMSNNNSIGTIDENGHVVEGSGIVNSEFTDISLNQNTSTSKGTNYAVIMGNSSTISQIIDSEFKNNTNTLTNTGSLNPYNYGNVLYLNNTDIGSSLTGEGGIINSVFENNTLGLYGSNDRVSAIGSVIYMTNSEISKIKDSVFKNNTTITDNSNANGAIYLTASSVIHSIENSQFIGNSAISEVHSTGGAINIADTAKIEVIKDSLFDGNHADGYSGGAINMTGDIGEINNTTFTNNTARYGASIFTNKATINSITNTLFTGNKAAGSGGAFSTYNSTLGSITDTDIIGNTASNQGGGAIIYTKSTLDLMENVKFENNHLENNPQGESTGGGLNFYDNAVIGTVNNVSFINNYITGVNSGVGGGMYIGSSVKADTLSNLTFDGNYINATGGGSGGGLMITSASTVNNLTDSVFKNNYIELSSGNGYGGGARFANSSFVKNFENITFENNGVIAPNNALGGALYVSSSTITSGIVNSIFRDNYVINTKNLIDRTAGGAIYSDTSLKIIANDGVTEFTGNYRMVEGDESSKIYEAIYLSGNNKVLTLNAITGGTTASEAPPIPPPSRSPAIIPAPSSFITILTTSASPPTALILKLPIIKFLTTISAA